MAVDITKMNKEQLQEYVATLSAENSAMKAAAAEKAKISFKVSDKGAVSVYGLSSRFPTTLYKAQWERLLDHSEQLKTFIKTNEALLSTTKPSAEEMARRNALIDAATAARKAAGK